jgi:hypothetical protein
VVVCLLVHVRFEEGWNLAPCNMPFLYSDCLELKTVEETAGPGGHLCPLPSTKGTT